MTQAPRIFSLIVGLAAAAMGALPSAAMAQMDNSPFAAQAAAKNKGTAPSGKYSCHFYSGYLQNVPGFTLAEGGKYTDHTGSGRWDWDAASGTVSFKGGAWNGQKVKANSTGTLQVLKANGSVGAVSCSKAK